MLIKVNNSYETIKEMLNIDFEKLKLICFYHDEIYKNCVNAFYKFNDKIYKFKIFNKNTIYSICLVNNLKQLNENELAYYNYILDLQSSFKINNKIYTYKEREIIHIYTFKESCQITYKIDNTSYNTKHYNAKERLLLEDVEATTFELLNDFIEDDEI